VPFLSAGDILRVWETASSEEPVDRALTILATVSSGASRDELARLPIGDRDARLLDVREGTFGPRATGVVACARCAERVEFALDLAALRFARPGTPEGEIDADGWTLRFRAPNSEDLSAAARAADPRRDLAGRCIIEARRSGAPVADPDLPADALALLAAAMAERDPQAEVLLDYACPVCGQQGQTHFDIAAFLWEEIRAQAQRLLMEVAALARAYGWREADILAMSPARRRAYLELAP
jgi:hypothetical protein